jgi:hypothetical protein
MITNDTKKNRVSSALKKQASGVLLMAGGAHSAHFSPNFRRFGPHGVEMGPKNRKNSAKTPVLGHFRGSGTDFCAEFGAENGEMPFSAPEARKNGEDCAGNSSESDSEMRIACEMRRKNGAKTADFGENSRNLSGFGDENSGNRAFWADSCELGLMFVSLFFRLLGVFFMVFGCFFRTFLCFFGGFIPSFYYKHTFFLRRNHFFFTLFDSNPPPKKKDLVNKYLFFKKKNAQNSKNSNTDPNSLNTALISFIFPPFDPSHPRASFSLNYQPPATSILRCISCPVPRRFRCWACQSRRPRWPGPGACFSGLNRPKIRVLSSDLIGKHGFLL